MSIVISCYNVGMNLEYSTDLPERYNRLTEPQIEILVNNPAIHFLYSGKDENGNHIVDFDC
jgi:hypothetical protein